MDMTVYMTWNIQSKDTSHTEKIYTKLRDNVTTDANHKHYIYIKKKQSNVK